METIHIRYEGQSIDLSMRQLDVGDLSTDDQVREAVATHLGVPRNKLAAFAVDRNAESGDLTLRPQAVFG
jgi:hypothetical protein